MASKTLTFQEKVNKLQVGTKAPKKQFNNFGKYSYRSCEDILEGIKPLMVELGLSVNLSDEIVMVGERYYVKATAILTDGENEFMATGFAREADQKKGMDASQVTGATSSYARKYALQGLLALDDNKDADYTSGGGNGNGGKPTPKPAPKQSAPAKGNGNGNGGAELPKIAGVTFKKITGKDGSMYVIADGDTYNKKTQLEKLGFKKRKDQAGNWVTYRPAHA